MRRQREVSGTVRMVTSFQVRVDRALRKRRARWKAQLIAKAVEAKRQEEANAERLVCLVGSETKLECGCLVCTVSTGSGKRLAQGSRP